MLGFKIEEDREYSEVTSYAGLLPYQVLWRRLGLPERIDETVHICGSQGWWDRQVIESVVLLNLAGGDCVTDIDKLEEDEGLCRIFNQSQYAGMSRSMVNEARARFRAGRKRTFPAATQIYTFLEHCHNEAEESRRMAGKAFIPRPNEHLRSLTQLNAYLIERVQQMRSCSEATLDCDATLVECEAKTAKMCYKGFPGYQPYNVYWAEQDVVLHSEFRDGNVPAGYDILRVFKEAVAMLPAGVKTIKVRQDTAAYINDLMGWFERVEEHPEYGRILFTISADITPEFKAAVEHTEGWAPLRGKQEWAEVVFVSNAQATLTGVSEAFRFIAIRERMSDQLTLIESTDQAPPFPTITMNGVRYKLHAIVTNRRDEPAPELIRWHYQRCGKSEEAHSIMKSDFAGGQLPSAKFGANAAWWAIMILSMNFNSVMRRFVLGSDKWIKRRMKAIRFDLIVSPGRIVHHARQMFLRVSRSLRELLLQIGRGLATITPAYG